MDALSQDPTEFLRFIRDMKGCNDFKNSVFLFKNRNFFFSAEKDFPRITIHSNEGWVIMINSPVIEMPELTACFTTIDCKPYMVPAHNAKQIPVVCSAAVFSFFLLLVSTNLDHRWQDLPEENWISKTVHQNQSHHHSRNDYNYFFLVNENL